MSNSKQSGVDGRKENFSRNLDLEALLTNLNNDLSISEKAILPMQSQMAMPVVLVMGPLRSGATLFTQWLANTGLVSYPTNLLSRFYQAPILGAKIQLLLTDPRYNFRDELGEFAQQAAYQSENGKTKGVLAPNEFWYFWRRFLADSSRDVWTDDELRQSMDVETMKAELVGMMDVFQKPFLAKGMLFNYNIPFLNSVLDKVVFVHIQRDPVMNVQSVLGARKRQLGSESAWYSFDIPEKSELMKLSPVEQAAGQVCAINNAISQGLKSVPEHKKVIVQYESFCHGPKKIFNQLKGKLTMHGYQASGDYSGLASFEPNNQWTRTLKEKKNILDAYNSFL